MTPARYLLAGLLALLLAALFIMPSTAPSQADSPAQGTLPDADYWTVIYTSQSDSLRWLNADGEFTAIPRPNLSPQVDTTIPPQMRMSRDGRYLIMVQTLRDSRDILGFYDVERGALTGSYTTNPGEFILLGGAHLTDPDSRFATIGVSTGSGWRVMLMELATGTIANRLESNDPRLQAESLPQLDTLILDGVEHFDGQAAHIHFTTGAGMTPTPSSITWLPFAGPAGEGLIQSNPYNHQWIDFSPVDGAALITFYNLDFAIPENPVGITTNALGRFPPYTAPDPNELTPLYGVNDLALITPHWARGQSAALFQMMDNDNNLRWHYLDLSRDAAVPIALDSDIVEVWSTPTDIIAVQERDDTRNVFAYSAEGDTLFADLLASYEEPARLVWASVPGTPLGIESIAPPPEDVVVLPPAPTATFTPRPAATIAPPTCQYDWFFTFRAGLGDPLATCPGPVSFHNAVGQDFEGGRVYLYEDLAGTPGGGTIWVIYNDGTWVTFTERANSDLAGTPRDPALVPPAERFYPMEAIANLWYANPQLRDNLGWAYERGQAFTGRMQQPIVPASGFPNNNAYWYIDHGKWGFVLRVTSVNMGPNTWDVVGDY
jgi:hypothetical protein